jgi:hypothetical protein
VPGVLEPHIVKRAVKPPGNCIASGATFGPFIDTAREVSARGHVYISVEWLENRAKELRGMVPKEEHEGRVGELEAELAVVREELEALAGLKRLLGESGELLQRVLATIEKGEDDGSAD